MMNMFSISPHKIGENMPSNSADEFSVLKLQSSGVRETDPIGDW
jgi:hypothetical protein